MTRENNMQQPKCSTPLALLSILPNLTPQATEFGRGRYFYLWTCASVVSFLLSSLSERFWSGDH